ncbi:GNAT family N-acetyltransferase [Muricoccus pecuniae]|uniref:Ribosomal-protein-alanine N-acetyltransferase n=1 Tax=Muricoccus pecuniae TaxID=693023 RepID=A0A840Y943_9PROT|nr:GNAT family N-acetyltransferase [Roseomonas pecuniae]MBB5692471.1 ribosomal-protein-alanine N-acetyltransferase [Roseomonas pecuniae]
MSAPSPPGAAIRPVAASDLPLLAALHARAFPPDERWGVVALGTMLGLEGGFGLVAGDGAPLGFVLARSLAGEAEILTIAVDPEARQRGLGTALLAAAAGEAGRRGAEVLFLEVSEANAPARALYARAGAAEVGRRRRYYTDGTDALVLRITPPS